MRPTLERIHHHLGGVLLPLALCAVVSLGLSALFDAFDRRAAADPGSIDDRTEDESPGLDHPIASEAPRIQGARALRQRDPFRVYPADSGAVRFDELSEDDRDTVEAVQEWAEADSGHHVHQAYRRATSGGVVRARAGSAERAVGLVGSATLGVR